MGSTCSGWGSRVVAKTEITLRVLHNEDNFTKDDEILASQKRALLSEFS